MLSKIDLEITKLISRLLKLDYKRAAIVKYFLFILFLVLLFILVVYLGITFLRTEISQNLNLSDNKQNNNLTENTTPTPTVFVIPTPTYTREEVILRNLQNEIPLNDNRLFYSITIKKNTELKLINLTQRPVILEMDNGFLIRVDIGSIQTVSFTEVGDFTIRDTQYQPKGFFIKVKVIE